jgi:hypothetical protein
VRDRTNVARAWQRRLAGPLERAVVVENDLVLAACLCGHHRCLGARDQLTGIHGVLGASRKADGDRDPPRGIEFAGSDVLDEPTREPLCVLSVP